jgi:hypothetical protein
MASTTVVKLVPTVTLTEKGAAMKVVAAVKVQSTPTPSLQLVRTGDFLGLTGELFRKTSVLISSVTIKLNRYTLHI